MNVAVIMAIAHEEDDQEQNHIHGVYASLDLFYAECKKRNRQYYDIDGECGYYDKHFSYVEKVMFIEGTTE